MSRGTYLSWNKHRTRRGFLLKTCFTVADKHAPIITRRVRAKTIPWLTPEIKSLMHDSEYSHKKALKTNNEAHWCEYKRLRNTICGDEPVEINSRDYKLGFRIIICKI